MLEQKKCCGFLVPICYLVIRGLADSWMKLIKLTNKAQGPKSSDEIGINP